MSAQRDHERIEELLAARALGGLDPDDRRLLARLRIEHGECALCEAFEAEYVEVAGRIGFGLQPVPVREGFEDEVVDAARGQVAFLAPRRRRRFTDLMPGPQDGIKRWLVGVAAAITLVAGAVGGYVVGREAVGPPVVATFEGSGPGTLAAAFVPGGDETVIVGTGLEPAPEGKTYELWMIADGTPVPGGTFEPTDGRVEVRLPADPSGSDLLAVTIERDGGVDAPTGKILYTAEIPV